MNHDTAAALARLEAKLDTYILMAGGGLTRQEAETEVYSRKIIELCQQISEQLRNITGR